jgi:hypothetical protein
MDRVKMREPSATVPECLAWLIVWYHDRETWKSLVWKQN